VLFSRGSSDMVVSAFVGFPLTSDCLNPSKVNIGKRAY
jgi:hypothetical protein